VFQIALSDPLVIIATALLAADAKHSNLKSPSLFRGRWNGIDEEVATTDKWKLF
jgi:hypothetical protein